MMVNDIARAFAMPTPVGLGAGDSAQVARLYFERVRKRVLEQLDEAAHRDLRHLVAMLDPRASACWRPAVGLAASMLQQTPLLAALQLLLISGDDLPLLDTALVEGGVLYVDGQAMQVTDHQQPTRMRAIGGVTPVALRHRLSSSELDGASSNGPRYLVEHGPSPAAVFPDPLQPAPIPSSPASASSEALQQAVALLAASSPLYAGWVASVVDGLLMTQGPAECVLSSPAHPGLLAVREGRDVLDYVELLVVGACQQRMFQLALLGRLTEPGNEQLHYLAHRRWYTSSRRALFAAHEHVNVLQLLNDVSVLDPSNAELARRIARRRLMFDLDCTPALERDRTLTALGRQLWTRLRGACLSGHRQHDDGRTWLRHTRSA
ncbi:hypothetical protein [Stenotrophomonas maltophilia]|uniref:hypothetical protein n=1 Tax=Stenotrophomonas maltophilia TaxID=40324 RepID=UPI000D0B0FFD|nr:hypothetical protein [Stenotrophomonas maltophilia]AVO32157.1 hypothetical protein C6Y55_20575 [Stenotrophomonas maltophilia]